MGCVLFASTARGSGRDVTSRRVQKRKWYTSIAHGVTPDKRELCAHPQLGFSVITMAVQGWTTY